MTEPPPRLVATDRGPTVLYQNRYLYSRRSPQARPVAIVQSTPISAESLIVVPSPLLFYGVDTLLANMPEKCHLICLETDRHLMNLSLEYSDQPAQNDRHVTFLCTTSAAQLVSEIDRLGVHRFRRVLALPLTGGYQLNKGLYDTLIAEAETHIQQHWQNRMTLMHMGRLWMKNVFSNLSRYSSALVNSTLDTDKPILVVGAGESLETALPLMAEFRERYFLLTVDTALPVLNAAGLSPDAVLVLEAQLVNGKDFIGHGHRPLNLICDLTSHPSVLLPSGFEKRFILSSFADCRIFDRMSAAGLKPELVRPLGSVGVAAVDLALRASPGPVMLVGLDFSYPLGKPHARGAPSHILTLCSATRTNPPGWYADSIARPLIRFRGKAGHPLHSDVVLNSYGKNLARALSGNQRVFDLRADGYPLNIGDMQTKSQMIAVLAAHAQNSFMPSSAAAKDHKRPDREAAADFLRNERTLLLKFLDAYRHASGNTAALAEMLRPIDYVYLDFPDSERWKDLSDDFLVRCAASASYYLRHVERVCEVADGS